MARPRLRSRSRGHPPRLEKRLARSPQYRSGSDIPQRLHPTAGRSRSFSLSPVYYACASILPVRYICCFPLIILARPSPVIVTYVVPH